MTVARGRSLSLQATTPTTGQNQHTHLYIPTRVKADLRIQTSTAVTPPQPNKSTL